MMDTARLLLPIILKSSITVVVNKGTQTNTMLMLNPGEILRRSIFRLQQTTYLVSLKNFTHNSLTTEFALYNKPF